MLPPETRYTWSGDYSIAYQVFGDGPRDLVIVPGWLSNLDLYWEEPNYVRFSKAWRRFAGSYCSTSGEQGYPIALAAYRRSRSAWMTCAR